MEREEDLRIIGPASLGRVGAMEKKQSGALPQNVRQVIFNRLTGRKRNRNFALGEAP